MSVGYDGFMVSCAVYSRLENSCFCSPVDCRVWLFLMLGSIDIFSGMWQLIQRVGIPELLKKGLGRWIALRMC